MFYFCHFISKGIKLYCLFLFLPSGDSKKPYLSLIFIKIKVQKC